MKYLMFAGLLLIVSCRHKLNPETSYSDKLPPLETSLIGKIKTIEILGNSLVVHHPLPSIGWVNDCGMAASAPDSDFVHILIRKIKTKDSSASVHFMNIAQFEADYTRYDFHLLDSFRTLNPDLIIMKIAENVKDSGAVAGHFIERYDSLLHYINPSGKALVVIGNGFWRKDTVNNLIYQYAISHKYPFINIRPLEGEPSNKALGQYQNQAVSNHPSNKGMKAIADKIWHCIEGYF